VIHGGCPAILTERSKQVLQELRIFRLPAGPGQLSSLFTGEPGREFIFHHGFEAQASCEFLSLPLLFSMTHPGQFQTLLFQFNRLPVLLTPQGIAIIILYDVRLPRGEALASLTHMDTITIACS
jgi:hypothetical protein